MFASSLIITEDTKLFQNEGIITRSLFQNEGKWAGQC
jgi:hypothetical protein